MKQKLNILNLQIGIAGCGEMGLPMLQVLLKNKICAFGYDIRKSSEFSELTDSFIESKNQFLSTCDVILSVVRNEEETLELTEGNGGIFEHMAKKYLLICSTLSPRFIKDLSALLSLTELDI